ncbi:UPF0187 protein At3g61320, chloroplastic-like [Hibiscus syriacus]|uniref:UPF0187 protein At3g61320, chloroplastic-like n=1 Tax=Hibiscus syriacus TaxID=106335 RepID=UPI0019203EAC|nr:UPF0187 protein At3g61320, chloroplastic-like [Hibiscus syriacus]
MTHSSNPSKLSLSSTFTPKPFLHFPPNSSLPTKFNRPPTFKILFSASQPPPPPPSSMATTSYAKTLNLTSLIGAIPDWADRIQERGMRQKRALYDHEKWVHHRSSQRHLRHLLSSLQSRVILSLVPPVLAFTSVAIVVATYNTAVDLHWLPDFFPMLRAYSLPYQLTAPALALLLVFRTEASYSRYEEGRKAWTKVIAGTNDLARQVIAGVDNSADDQPIKSVLLHYIMAFPVALKCHVLYGSDIGSDLQNLIEVDDLAVILHSKHRPRCIIYFISQSLKLLNLEETKRTMLESTLSCFHEGIGVCDQLMGVPIPLSYTRLKSRFLVLWHLTLPIILWDDCH